MSKLKKLSEKLKDLSLQKESDVVLSLNEEGFIKVALLSEQSISEGLKWHIDNNIPLSQPVYRLFSEAYFSLLTEAKTLYKTGQLLVDETSEWMLSDDSGLFAEYDGVVVPLDCPMALDEEEKILKMAAEYKGKNVSLNSPKYLKKGDPGYGKKQYVVYVKDGDKVKRITFGDASLKAKPGNAKARKSFRARHKCDQKKDKTTPGYWACRHPPQW